MRNLIIYLFLLLPLCINAQESKKRIRLNAGVKVGFQAITYNDPTFEIEGYTFNENTIQSNKIGYTLAPFLRLSRGRYYIQTEAAFGITLSPPARRGSRAVSRFDGQSDGSGTSLPEVNKLLKQFEGTRKMMKSVMGGNMGNMMKNMGRRR